MDEDPDYISRSFYHNTKQLVSEMVFQINNKRRDLQDGPLDLR